MNKKYLKLAVFSLIGALGGFAYYYYIGCYNGQCLISSNPYISTVYGTAAGLLMGWDTRKKPDDNQK